MNEIAPLPVRVLRNGRTVPFIYPMLPSTLSDISLKMTAKPMTFDANCNSTYKIKERKQKKKEKIKKHENSSYKFELFSDSPE